MPIQILPLIDRMLELYAQPISMARFEAYIQLLEGGKKGDISLPISGFNPMAKPHVREKLLQLKALGAEEIMENTLRSIHPSQIKIPHSITLQVGLNLSDDLMGGWTNRYSSDFDSKFKLNAFVERNFCVPIFWTGEEYSEAMIAQRTLAYFFRTQYWFHHPKPRSLKDHFLQEEYVAKEMETKEEFHQQLAPIKSFLDQYSDTEERSTIFHFFYGREGSEALGMKDWGLEEGFFRATQ